MLLALATALAISRWMIMFGVATEDCDATVDNSAMNPATERVTVSGVLLVPVIADCSARWICIAASLVLEIEFAALSSVRDMVNVLEAVPDNDKIGDSSETRLLSDGADVADRLATVD